MRWALARQTSEVGVGEKWAWAMGEWSVREWRRKGYRVGLANVMNP